MVLERVFLPVEPGWFFHDFVVRCLVTTQRSDGRYCRCLSRLLGEHTLKKGEALLEPSDERIR